MRANWHLVWLWAWFFIGMATYWLKRAYFFVTGPNPAATTYGQFLRLSWAPLLVRSFADSMVYWIFFIPGMADKALAYFGWTTYSWALGLVTQFAPFAAIFGHSIDSVVDFALLRVPVVKDWLPQMPSAPAPPPAADGGPRA